MKQKIINRYLFSTVFITGAAVLIIEVAAVRILSPVYGSSLYVLSSVLTIILAALSAGYWYGGKRADREQSVSTLYSIIAISGLCVLGLLLFSQFLPLLIDSILSPTVGPLILSFLLFFTPAFLLGIVSPYIIKLQSIYTPTDKIGSVVGGIFFWGTAGSIIGSLLTGFVFIPGIGVTKTILLTGIILIALGILVPFFINQPLQRKKIGIYIFVSIIICSLIYKLDAEQKNYYTYSTDGIYSQIIIKEILFNNQPARILQRDHNSSSAIYLESDKLVFPYTQFSLLYNKLVPETKRVLVLGGGAYTVPRALIKKDPNLLIDVVEIEPELFNLAQEYFDLSDISNITNYPVDGRVFFKNPPPEKYDFIFSDMFGTDLAPPFHLTTYEFYKLLSTRLNENGVLMLNVIGVPGASKPSLIGSVAKTLKTTFPTVKAYGLDKDQNVAQNVIFIASNSNKPIQLSSWELSKINSYVQDLPFEASSIENEILLTDDLAPVAYLMTKQ